MNVTFHELTAPDGSIAIMQLVEGADLNEALAKHAGVSFTPVAVREIDPAIIPQDRTFRNAWRRQGDAIGHDMDVAREIHRKRIRKARAPMLAELDVKLSRAMFPESGLNAADVEKERQRLRDATKHPSIENAKTVDELKAAWPL